MIWSPLPCRRPLPPPLRRASVVAALAAIPLALLACSGSDDSAGTVQAERCTPLSLGAWPTNAERLWNDVGTYEVNRERARATFTAYPDLEAAAQATERSPFTMSLNGSWSYRFAESPSLRPEAFETKDFDVSYRIFATGEVAVSLALVSAAGLPEFPRFGMKTELSETFDRIEWFGPGPEPTYSDRKLLAVGRYETLLADATVPYARPQESGNRADVRFAAITDSSGNGLLAVGAPRLSVNASLYSAQAVESAAHPHELIADGNVHVNFDLAQRGVGGIDSWGKLPLDAYILKATERSYRYWLRPLRAGDDPAALARRSLSE